MKKWVICSSYDISKSASDNCKKFQQESTRPLLIKTAEFLGCDTIPKGMKKAEIAKLIIERLATLLLKPCRICIEYYAVNKLCDAPLMRCYFCGQGCHNDCYENAGAVAGMFFICMSCEHEEKENLKLNTDCVKPSTRRPKTAEEHSQEHAPAELVYNEGRSGAPKDSSSISHGKKKTPSICKFFKKGSCKYGLSGTSGGKCKYHHPKICHKYANYGKFGEKGCNSQL